MRTLCACANVWQTTFLQLEMCFQELGVCAAFIMFWRCRSSYTVHPLCDHIRRNIIFLVCYTSPEPVCLKHITNRVTPILFPDFGDARSFRRIETDLFQIWAVTCVDPVFGLFFLLWIHSCHQLRSFRTSCCLCPSCTCHVSGGSGVRARIWWSKAVPCFLWKYISKICLRTLLLGRFILRCGWLACRLCWTRARPLPFPT